MADKPVTREEKYLAYLTGDYTGELPKPITRKEKYLYELCLKGMGGEVSPEEIKNAVNEYLEKNPVKPGATTEQAQQIEQNKTDIGSLKTETSSLKEGLRNVENNFDIAKSKNIFNYKSQAYNGTIDTIGVLNGKSYVGLNTSRTAYITYIIQVEGGKKYSLKGDPLRRTLAFFDDTFTKKMDGTKEDGWIEPLITIPLTDSITVVAPDKAKYMTVCVDCDENLNPTRDVYNCMIYEGDEYPNTYIPYVEPRKVISSLVKLQSGNFGDYDVLNSVKKETGINVFSPNGVKIKSARFQGNYLSSASNYNAQIVEIEPNEQYVLDKLFIGDVSFFNDTLLHQSLSVSKKFYGYITSQNLDDSRIVNTPSGSKYMSVYYGVRDESKISNAMICKGENMPKSYAPYVNDYFLNSDIKVRKENIFDENVGSSSDDSIPNVIIDTDFSTDSDDVVALRLAQWGHREGIINLRAVIADAVSIYSGSALNAMMINGETPNVKIGIYKGDNAVQAGTTYSKMINENFSHTINSNDDCDNGVILYRKILASCKDKVTIVCIGVQTVLAELLKSMGDGYSSMNGAELIKNKCAKLIVMGCEFPRGHEYNIYTDAASAKYVAENWTTEIIYCGFEVGNSVKTAKNMIIIDPNKTDLLTKSIDCDNSVYLQNGKSSYDAMSIYALLFGYNNGVFKTVRGIVSIDGDGNNTFEENENGNHLYLIKTMTDTVYANAIDEKIFLV